MRILSITAQKPNSTGSGVYLTELVREFAAAGHVQAVVAGVYRDDAVELPAGAVLYPVYFDTPDLPFPIVGMSDEMPYPSTRYCDMTAEMVSRFCRAFLQVLRPLVGEFRPDVILCHHLYLLTAIVRSAFPRARVFGFCHNTDLRQMQKTDLERDLIRGQIRRLDHIFVAQRAQQDAVAEIYGVEPARITRIGVGYNAAVFYPAGTRKKDGVTRLAYAGKIAEKKGVCSLIRSLAYLDVPADRLRLYLAGGAGNRAEYAAICALAQGSRYPIELLGRLSQTELAGVYNRCDIFVLPSFFDGSPLTVIEALACGCRVVMTRLPGIPEWIDEAVKHADIRYTPLPELRNTDEPVPAALPAFERRLAAELEASIRQGVTVRGDPSGASWRSLADAVVGQVGADARPR